jgi:hypothetical protein
MRYGNHLRDDEMLRLVDGHLTPADRAHAESHVAACVSCSGRRSVFARIAGARAEPDETTARHASGRARLRARLGFEADLASRRWPLPLQPARWVAAVAVAAVGLAAVTVMRSRGADSRGPAAVVEADARPVASLTPGATIDIEIRDVCVAARPPQEIGPAVRQAVLRSYGMEAVPPDQYELDYLITPQLGGAPDPRNLWPQRYRERVWNAWVKDQLEDLLPRFVCEGRVDLRTAQRDVAADWVAAYRKYFRTISPLRPATALASLSIAAPLFPFGTVVR